MKLKLLTMAAMALALQGCGTSASCGDSGTVQLIKDDFYNKVAGFMPQESADALQQIKNRVKLTLSTITTDNQDPQVGKYWCSAVMQADLSSDAKDLVPALENAIGDASVRGISLGVHQDGKTLTANISYTSQLTEDKQHVIQLGGDEGMARLLAAFGMNGVFK
jgi:hypothetical protein